MDLPAFEEFVISEGWVKETGWIERHFIPELKKLIIHLFQGGQEYLLKTSSVGEFFALDIIMGTDGKLHMLELNNSPSYGNHLRDRRVLFNTQIPPMLEIPFKYIASRYRRVRRFLVEKLIPKMKTKEYQTNPQLKEELLQQFDKLNTDYLEEDL